MIRWLALGALAAGAAQADIRAAAYLEPTGAYGHNVVPDGEYAQLSFELDDGTRLTTDAEGGVY